AQAAASPPHLHENQGHQWRGGQPPKEEHFDVVPYPGCQSDAIRQKKPKCEWQAEDQRSGRYEPLAPVPYQSEDQKWHEPTGVFQPEPKHILGAVVPTELPTKERSRPDLRPMGGPKHLRGAQNGREHKER